MNCHQVLTGSANSGSYSYDVGQINNFTFWVYGSGCDLVISSSSEQPIQIISNEENVLITAVDCTEVSGKIAVAYGKKVVIFTPHAVEDISSWQKYHWDESSSFQLKGNDGEVNILSWNFDESYLLVGCSRISMWYYSDACSNSVSEEVWKHTWSSGLDETPLHLAFSPNNCRDMLFASVAKGECMVKIWYKRHCMNNLNISDCEHGVLSTSDDVHLQRDHSLDFTFTYLLHPQPVVGFEWRKNFSFPDTDRFSNVLISSCQDQICRIWCETKQPVSRLLRFESTTKSWSRSGQRKGVSGGSEISEFPSLEISFQNPAHDFNIHQDVRHFHIASSINPIADIPLLPSFSGPGQGSYSVATFTVHWLNNKYHQSQVLKNKFDAELSSRSLHKFSLSGSSYPASSAHVYDHCMSAETDASRKDVATYGLAERLIHTWRNSRDALYSIHPADGSLLVWHVDWLDEDRAGKISQPQVCFSSRIPMAFSSADAATLRPRMILFVNHTTKPNILHSSSYMSFQSGADSEKNAKNNEVYSSVQLLSKHCDGSLNLWRISFSDSSDFSSITSICHSARFCGHCFHLSGISSHPLLPLMVTTAGHKSSCDVGSPDQNELILWRVDPIGPLSYSGGLSELARVSCIKDHLFTNVAWFPVLFPSWCLGFHNNSPSTALISFSQNKLQIYQAVVDAGKIISGVYSPMSVTQNNKTEPTLVSQQSSAHPGCMLHLASVTDEERSWGEILFIETFPTMIMTPSAGDSIKQNSMKFKKDYFVVMLENTGGISTIHTWLVVFSANMASLKKMGDRRATIQMLDSSDESSEDDVENAPQILSHVTVNVTKLSTQQLHFANDSKVVSACSWAGHFTLLFASEMENHLYPAPYHLCTACSDNSIYLWSCSILPGNDVSYETCHWKLRKCNLISGLSEEHIPVKGRPVMVKAASPALIACLYVANQGENKGLAVSVYECASSGGSSWKEQELIEYHASSVSSTDLLSNFHLDWLSQEEGSFFLAVGYATNIQIFSLAPCDVQDCINNHLSDITTSHTSSLSSMSPTKPQLMRQSSLDVHTRHRLLSSQKMKYENTKGDWFQLVKKSVDESNQWKLLQWTKLAELDIQSPARPLKDTHTGLGGVTVSWARDGMLVAASATEMHVFSQWMPDRTKISVAEPRGNLLIGLSEVVDRLCPSLPQYHPRILSELLNSGHLDVVRSILIHLAICMNGDYHEATCHSESVQIEKFQFCELLATSMQLCSSSSHITPLFLHEVLGNDGSIKIVSAKVSKAAANVGAEHNQQSSTIELEDFLQEELKDTDKDDMADELDEILGLKSGTRHSKPNEKIDLSKLEPNYFGKEHCKVIHEFLIHNQLPGLNSHDQMELMALADTLDMTNASSFREGPIDEPKDSDINQSFVPLTAGERGYAVSGSGAGALDNCGLRFVMALHNHLCLLNSLPAANRAVLLNQGLGSCQFAWAFHSDAEEEILSLLPSVQRGAPQWSELQSLGAGWWIRSTPLLRKLIEQTARASFLAKNDPLDAALFYLALNKKSVLCGLFRSVKNLRMLTFFQNNFSEERWHRAALKNAFALMGKQRFQEAAAFFLLAGSVRDAVEVCIEKLKDIQLALVICRLREKTDVTYHQLLEQLVLGDSSDDIKLNHHHPDAFLRSMAQWTLGNYGQAVSTLLEHIHYKDITDIFNFYMYLRSHPVVLRTWAQNDEKSALGLLLDQDQKLVSKQINEQERKLIFQTAVAHLEAGCPILALDSLARLPDVPTTNVAQPDENKPESDVGKHSEVVGDMSYNVDWSEPNNDTSEEKLVLDWSEDEQLSDNDEEIPILNEIPKIVVTNDPEVINQETKTMKHDVFAHHLRMTACFKIFVQELKAIACAYSSDGGHLRSKLYFWLENASVVFHRVFGLSEFTIEDNLKPVMQNTKVIDTSSDNEATTSEAGSVPVFRKTPSLHELILADNHDWKTRRTALTRRRKWLQRHHNFLRTLLSYCNLHESAFGLLATMRMELLLLLQESIQNRSLIHLSSPLPSPSENIPLITSVVATCKTVVADPFTHLSHMTKDILHSVLEFSMLPHPDHTHAHKVVLLCSQAAALSSCIYQSLCDTSTPSFQSQLLKADEGTCDGVHEGSEYSSSPSQNFLTPTFLQQSATPIHTSNYVAPTTTPVQWPGVAVLQALLNSEMSSGESRMKIIVLLCEATAAVYMSLLIHALQSHNASLMYRLAIHKLGTKMWNAVFGGGVKLQVKYAKSRFSIDPGSSTDLQKLRKRLNLKLLHNQDRRSSVSSSGGQEQSAYREKFVPPETSLWDWFLTKPFVSPLKEEGTDFDSDVENEDTDTVSSINSGNDDCDFESNANETKQGNCELYSWKLMRMGLVQTVTNNFQSFLSLGGLDISELNANSPLLSATMQLLQEWQRELVKEIEECGGPPNAFLPSLGNSGYVCSSVGLGMQRPAVLKYQAMLEPNNTPFQGSSKEIMGYKRLWHSLVKQENLQETFIKYIFHKSAFDSEFDHENILVTNNPVEANVPATKQEFGGKVTILHKEADLVAAFCLNKVNSNCIALASSKDIQELDLSVLLTADSWAWIDEPVSGINTPTSGDDDGFLIVSTPSKSSKAPHILMSRSQSSIPWSSKSQTGQGANILMKRPVTGIRRMDSHPTLPYYLTGSRDGSICMWEWGHQQQISQYQSGHFSKISNLHFSALGNKICAVDADGCLTMWQVSSSSKPYLRLMCHDRGAHDCCFVSSASVLATAGMSSSSKNVAVWDTLMPKKSCLVKGKRYFWLMRQ